MQLVCPMPIIHFRPLPADAKKKPQKSGPHQLYQCPTYYYPTRTGERSEPIYVSSVMILVFFLGRGPRTC